MPLPCGPPARFTSQPDCEAERVKTARLIPNRQIYPRSNILIRKIFIAKNLASPFFLSGTNRMDYLDSDTALNERMIAMASDKRPRGRPPGEGKKDSRYLMQVADLLVRDPSLKPTTAMKRVMCSRKDWDETDETLLRRWQIKWKKNGESFLGAARERSLPKPVSSGTAYYPNTGAGTPNPLQEQFMRDSRMRDILDPPGMRLMRQMERQEKLMRDMIDPPGARMMRKMEQQERIMRDIIDPPLMRKLRQQDEIMRKLFNPLRDWW